MRQQLQPTPVLEQVQPPVVLYPIRRHRQLRTHIVQQHQQIPHHLLITLPGDGDSNPPSYQKNWVYRPAP
jgi:hypothetical protein